VIAVRWFTSRSLLTRVAVVLAVLGTTPLVMAFAKADPMEVTAYFTESKGIYVGDDVTMLSVPIGTITDIHAEPDRVRVEMEVDPDVELPADVNAAIVGRSLVSVRSIALGPVYKDGARLVSGDTIPISRTAVPVEWDEVKQELVQLARALGPRGADKDGAASRLVRSTAAYLHGRGQSIRETAASMADALETLDDNSGGLFATVRNLQVFVTALNQSDAQIHDFNVRLAAVSDMLDGDRTELAAAFSGMRHAFRDAKPFLEENTGLTADTLRSIDETLSVIAERRTNIADILQVAPTGISNWYNIQDPRVSAPTGELAPANFASIAGIVCGALTALDPEGGDVSCRDALEPMLNFLDVNGLPSGVSPVTSNGGLNGGGGGTSTPEEENILGGHR